MPKYLRNTNNVNPIAQIIPRLELLRIIDVVKSSAKKRVVKNKNKTIKEVGSNR